MRQRVERRGGRVEGGMVKKSLSVRIKMLQGTMFKSMGQAVCGSTIPPGVLRAYLVGRTQVSEFLFFVKSYV